jgi:hypothetical protein
MIYEEKEKKYEVNITDYLYESENIDMLLRGRTSLIYHLVILKIKRY